MVHPSAKYSSEDNLAENVKPLAAESTKLRSLIRVRIRRIRVLKIEIAMNSCTLLQFEPVAINI